MKWEIGFQEYLQYIKGAPSRLFLTFCSGIHGLFEELGRHDKVGWSQECPNCGNCKDSVEHVLFEHASYDFQRIDFLDHLKKVLSADAFKALFSGNIFDKDTFCLGKKHGTGMLVKDE